MVSSERYAFTYENRNRSIPEDKRFISDLRYVFVHRGEYGEILEQTHLDIIDTLSKSYHIKKRVFSNVVELENGDRISWQGI
jgi:hypothetical protein